MRQRGLVVVEVGHRLERSEEVGDGVGSVLSEESFFASGYGSRMNVDMANFLC